MSANDDIGNARFEAWKEATMKRHLYGRAITTITLLAATVAALGAPLKWY